MVHMANGKQQSQEDLSHEESQNSRILSNKGLFSNQCFRSISFHNLTKKLINKPLDRISSLGLLKISSFGLIDKKKISSSAFQRSINLHKISRLNISQTQENLSNNRDYLIIDEDFWCKTEMMQRRSSF